MNAVDLVAAVSDIIQDPGYSDDDFLGLLNGAQLAAAEGLCLPGLADGAATVVTVAGAMYATLPPTFHKNIYLAKNETIGVPVKVFTNAGIMSQSLMEYPSVSNAGDVVAVTVHAGRLMYQRVPTEVQSISLMFYRFPVAMTLDSSSFPDGMSGARSTQAEAYDRALVHNAAWKMFEKIEQGTDGQKIDTKYHHDAFMSAMRDLSPFCIKEEVQVFPLTNRCW